MSSSDLPPDEGFTSSSSPDGGSSGPAWARADEKVVESFFDRARQNLHCRIACGGATCKHEDFRLYLDRPGVHPAIHGLNSNFVGDVVVASQRPSTVLFQRHGLIDQFRQKKVTAIFNLQEKGEHAFCGPNGIFSDSGYSYNGERDVMRFGLSYYEFPWPDMTAPENDIVFRSVQCMDSHIRQGKGRVLVHCHAGLGRTGLMIAAYFIMSQHMPAKEAIELVRMSRPGAVQTSRQVEFVEGFEKFVHQLGYTMKRSPADPKISFVEYMERQYDFLHGEESRLYKHVPWHVHQILCRVIDLASTGGRNAATEALMAFSLANEPSIAVVDACRDAINKRKYDPQKTSNLSLLVFLVLDWFRSMDEPFFGQANVAKFLGKLRKPLCFLKAARAKMMQQQQSGTKILIPVQALSINSATATAAASSSSGGAHGIAAAGRNPLRTLPNSNNTTPPLSAATPPASASSAAVVSLPTMAITVQPPNSSSHMIDQDLDDDHHGAVSFTPTATEANHPVPPALLVSAEQQQQLPEEGGNPGVVDANDELSMISNATTSSSSSSTPQPLPQHKKSAAAAAGAAVLPQQLQPSSLVVSPSSVHAVGLSTFEPRHTSAPWALQQEVGSLPKSIEHTAALVLSAIATLVAEAAPMPGLFDLAIQSTVDAFTLSLPNNAVSAYYNRRGLTTYVDSLTKSDPGSGTHSKQMFRDEIVANNTTRAALFRKQFVMQHNDRWLLYEAFGQWCVHTHSTYFEPTAAAEASGGAAFGKCRIISSLASASEARMPNFQSKMQQQQAVSSGRSSMATTPQSKGILSGVQPAPMSPISLNFAGIIGQQPLSNNNSLSMMSGTAGSAAAAAAVAAITLSPPLRPSADDPAKQQGKQKQQQHQQPSASAHHEDVEEMEVS